MTKNTEILIVLAIAIALNYIPVVGMFVKCFNTLVHESSHALMSLLFSGEVVSVDLFYSGEGVATTKSSSWLSKFLISMAGYIGSSVVSAICVYLIAHQHYQYILYFFLSLATINLIFWVRNLYGITWLVIVIAGLSALFYFQLFSYQKWAALMITAIVFVDAWVSSAILLVLSVKNSKKAGDASNLQKIALLPAFFWALLFLSQATFLALWSIHQFLPLTFLFSK